MIDREVSVPRSPRTPRSLDAEEGVSPAPGGGAWGGPVPSLDRASQSSRGSVRSVPPGRVTRAAESLGRDDEMRRYSSLPGGPGGRGPGDEGAGAAAAAVEYGGVHGSPSGGVGVESSYLSRRLADGGADDGGAGAARSEKDAESPDRESDYIGTVEERRTPSRDRVDSRDHSSSRTSYAEWAANSSAGGGMPKKRSLDSWRDDGGMDDGSGGNRGASASSSPGKGRRPKSPGAVRQSRSANDVTDLEVLGVTVQGVNAALSSGAVPASPGRAPDGAARSGEAQPYVLSGAKFHPRGCVWDVSIQVLPAPGAGEDDSATWESTWQSTSKRSLMVGVGFEFDVKIHCVADEDPNPDGPGAAVDGEAAAATRSAYTIEITLVHDDPDERALWQNYPAEISGATEWLRRKIRRKLRQGAGGRFPVPAVEVGLPGKVEFPTQVVADDGTLTDPPSPGDDPLDDVLEGRPVKLVSVPTPPDLAKDVQRGPGALSSLMKTSPLPHDGDHHGAPSPPKSAGGRPGLLKKSSYTNRVQAEAAAGVRDRDGGRRKGKVVPPATIDIPSPTGSRSEHSELGGSVPAGEAGAEGGGTWGARRGHGARAEDVAASPPGGRGEESKGRGPDGRGSRGAAVEDAPLKQSDRARSEYQEGGRKSPSSRRVPPMDNNSGHGSGDSGYGSQQGSLRGSISQRQGMQMRMGLMSQQTVRKLTENLDNSDTGSENSVAVAVPSSSKGEAWSSYSDDEKPNGKDNESVSSNDENIPQELLRTLKNESGNSERRSSFRNSQVRMAKKGLLSKKSLRRLSISAHSNEELSDAPCGDDGRAEEPNRSEQEKNIRHAKRGLMSQDTMRKLSLEDSEKQDKLTDDDKYRPRRGRTNAKVASMSNGEKRSAMRGIMSRRSMMMLEDETPSALLRDEMADHRDRQMSDDFQAEDYTRTSSVVLTDGELDAAGRAMSSTSLMSERHVPEGEIRMANLGLASRKTMANFRAKGLVKNVSFSAIDQIADGKKPGDDAVVDKPDSTNPTAGKVVIHKRLQDIVAKEDKESLNTFVFSDNEFTKPQGDIFTEGQYFLGVSMLVYMYSHLRETCRMGHTRCEMEDIDVHSLQSTYKRGTPKRYLKGAKSAGSIIRVVIDELDTADGGDEDNDIVGEENKEYEKSITEQFRIWIEESRIDQMDDETKEMIAEMKRKVARHRWRRAISAVRLSYRIAGKPPRWEEPVCAPGCENQNRFVDMNEMVSQAMRKQPKYFREGSVMHNLIESGIEVVWFSDMSQNDVVYGICVCREERKVTVVFRGTVNAHNWKMNLKFDTNEYRNPVKQNYPDREDELSLHSGFAMYLLRKRKDSGINKLQEIFDKIDEIGREMAPDGNYKLCITGHSLGGALATLTGFYAAARSRFAHLDTIYVWTFAAPRVGTVAFIKAWQHLEKTGRIRHARFSATRDIVPLVPFCNFERDDLQFYKHVGVRIQLHPVGRLTKWRLKRHLDVTYPLHFTWMAEIQRAFMNNILANLTTLGGITNNHKLTEYQKRLHFAITYRKALGSGDLFSDRRRNRIKTLDEYYHIRANITGASIAQEILEQSKVTAENAVKQRPQYAKRLFTALLMVTWGFLLATLSANTFGTPKPSLHMFVGPMSHIAVGVWHIMCLPVTLPHSIYSTVTVKTKETWQHLFLHMHDSKRTAFVGRFRHKEMTMVFKNIAAERATNRISVQTSRALSTARELSRYSDEPRRILLDNTSRGLFNLALLLDSGSEPQLTLATPDDDPGEDVEAAEPSEEDQKTAKLAELKALESELKPIVEHSTGISFEPKLNGLYLVGAGVRKKSIVKVYSVAMYSSPTLLPSASSSTSLKAAAQKMDDLNAAVTFLLEMVYSITAEKIASAIAESIRPRYHGPQTDIAELETLIVKGVNEFGGQASKGTSFQFECTCEGVSVSVNGSPQGSANFGGLGTALVGVFTDENAVSPSLVDSCVSTWSDKKAQALAGSLLALSSSIGSGDKAEGEAVEDEAELGNDLVALESELTPLQEYATSVTFQPKLDSLYLVGAGVRKKSIVKVYAVAMYSSAQVLVASSSQDTLHSAARSFDELTPTTTFILEMVYSASAEKIAGAIAESVKPRYRGSESDVASLESLIAKGVNSIGGQAVKGTIFRFECSGEGVAVIVNGSHQGDAKFAGLGGAFVDVFTDAEAVSPSLVESCISTWSTAKAQGLAASLNLAVANSSDETSTTLNPSEDDQSSANSSIDAHAKPLQDYLTGIAFEAKLDELYLAGVGVRKKSIVKVYAVAMYASAPVLKSTISQSTLNTAARTFDELTRVTSFVLHMTYSVGAEKIASAIGESVHPRYSGSSEHIKVLETLIIDGVNKIGGQASKGTTFRFDCDLDGVEVSVNGMSQGYATFDGLGAAFVDVFTDENAVSQTLVDSCLDTWTNVD